MDQKSWMDGSIRCACGAGLQGPEQARRASPPRSASRMAATGLWATGPRPCSPFLTVTSPTSRLCPRCRSDLQRDW